MAAVKPRWSTVSSHQEDYAVSWQCQIGLVAQYWQNYYLDERFISIYTSVLTMKIFLFDISFFGELYL